MTNFSWWQNRAGDHGLVMCMLCFEDKLPEDMWVDEHGDMWDTCLICRAYEEEVMREREREAGPTDTVREVAPPTETSDQGNA